MTAELRKKQLAIVASSLVLLAVLPFVLSASYHDSQRLISILVMTAALGVVVCRMTVSVYLAVSAFALVSLGGVLVFTSPSWYWSLVEFAMLFLVFFLAVAWRFKLDERQIVYFSFIFVAVQAVYVLRNLVNYSIALFLDNGIDSFLIVDGFSNVRFYGQFLIWTVPFVVGVLALQKSMSYRFLIIGVLAIGCGFTLLTGTRAFIFSMCASLLAVVVFTSPRYAQAYAKQMLLVLSGAVLCYVWLALVLPWIAGVDLGGLLQKSLGRDLVSSSGRLVLWSHAGAAIQVAPLWGIGPMMTSSTDFYGGPAHPHNYLIQFAVEWGIVFTCLLIFIVLGLLYLWRTKVQEDLDNRVCIALPIIAALSAGAAGGLVTGIIVMPVSLVYMTLMIALAVNAYALWTPQIQRFYLPKWLSIMLLIPPLFLCLFTVMTYGDSTAALERKARYGLDSAIDHPRFWSQGKPNIQLNDGAD